MDQFLYMIGYAHTSIVCVWSAGTYAIEKKSQRMTEIEILKLMKGTTLCA